MGLIYIVTPCKSQQHLLIFLLFHPSPHGGQHGVFPAIMLLTSPSAGNSSQANLHTAKTYFKENDKNEDRE